MGHLGRIKLLSFQNSRKWIFLFVFLFFPLDIFRKGDFERAITQLLVRSSAVDGWYRSELEILLYKWKIP